MPIVLIYHDVVPTNEFDASGIPGPGAARYKLFEEEFQRHLDALARVAKASGHGTFEQSDRQVSQLPCVLTFDDGGKSACSTVAGLLEECGWRGHFYITTDFIDTPGFLTQQEISLLHGRGHVIGSHSCSHPQRMSACTWDQLVDEWRQSCDILSAIIGKPVTAGSVPGGFFSRRVAEAAAQAGIRTLFTSEPSARPYDVDGCIVQGRYSIDRSVSVETMAAIASGKLWSRLRQTLTWQAKKAAKSMAGPLYAAIRERVLRLSYDSHQPAPHGKVRTSGASS